MKYTCTDQNCEFCYITRVQMVRGTPMLPPEYVNDINRAGGWQEYRDQALLENMKPRYSDEIRMAKARKMKRDFRQREFRRSI